MPTRAAIERPLRTALALLALLGIAGLLAGCAHTYVDADGTRNVVGLLWLRLPPTDGRGAESLRVRSVGVSVTSTQAGSALVLGYSDSNVVLVRDNQFVDAAPLLGPPQ